MKLMQDVFWGLIPRLESNLLPDRNAAVAINAKLDTGALKPFRAGTTVNTPIKSGIKKSIYRFAPVAGNDNSGFWFHWTTDVDVIRSPARNDVSERTYYTGDGIPKVTDNVLALTGGTAYPVNSYTMGVPQPIITPTVTVTGTAVAEAEEEDRLASAYVFTYVNSFAEESAPSPESAIVSWLPGETRTLSDLGTAPAGNYNFISKRIYRKSAAEGSFQFFLVGEIAISTTSFIDNVEEDLLGDELITDGWFMPPADMHSLGMLDNGIAFGASKNLLYPSVIAQPHAYNPLWAQPTTHPIVATGSFGNTIVAITLKNPFIFQGYDPASLAGTEIKNNQGCVSKRSVVSGPFGVIYASPDGLVLIGEGSMGNVITSQFLTRDQWQAYKPATLLGALYNGVYMGFYDAGGGDKGAFILDPQNPEAGFVELSLFATAAYADPLSDHLYLCVNGSIVTFDTGTDLQYTWRSKRYIYNKPVNMTAVRVVADDYDDITLVTYANGVQHDSRAVTSRAVFRIPYANGYEWQYELIGTSKVTSIELAETPDELVRS